MRWKKVFVGLTLTLAATAGCKQQIFMTESDFNLPVTVGRPNLDRDPNLGAQPIIAPVGKPPSVLDPDRPVRYLSLAEAISIGLEQGSVGTGQPIPSGSPFQDEDLSFAGSRVSTPNSIRVLALDPAAVGTNIELALSKFDAVFNTSLSWSKTDQPLANQQDLLLANGQQAVSTDGAQLLASLFKPLPSGGTAGITFDVPYQLTNQAAPVNPSYTPSVQFQFEQPLLQGFGTEINQLRQTHPGSLLLPNGSVLSGLPQPGVEGILVTRIRFDQQRAEFQRNVNTMLSNVEVAYWNLYYGYWNLYAQEAALRQAYEAWKIAVVKLQAGKIAVADVAQTRGQYELFRSQRLTALDQLLESERQLRGLLGLPVEDGTRLTPSDSPTLAAYQPDWNTAQAEALNNAPSLIMLREQVKADQMNVRLAENSLLPDLRFGATYNVNSIGSTLEGSDANNALRNLASDHFNNWSLALRLNVPIGYRNAYANVRLAKLTMARDTESLKEQERRVVLALAAAWRGLSTNYEQIKALRAQREAFGDQVKATFQEFQAGKITPDLLLEAQRFWAQALSSEYAAVRDYNNSLAYFEAIKGTIAQHDNVVIAEGPLPAFASERAVEHQRQRSAALEVRERAKPAPLAETHVDQPIADVPVGAQSHAAPLPELWQSMPPLKDVPALPALTGAPAVPAAKPAAATLGALPASGPALAEPNPTPANLPTTPIPVAFPPER